MAEKSTFFNSVSGDRKYKAEDMAAHFAKLITNGVFPSGTQLQVTEDAGMRLIVSAGSAWINGYAYHNDNDFTLDFDAADGVLNRIDRVVVRWSRLNRAINLAIVKGTPASTPIAPAVTRTADNWELGIATVAINAGTTTITQSMITDTRLDSNVCGFVSSLIQPDTSGWFAQFGSAFNTWFETIEDVLDENTAGNLLNLINAHKAETAKFIADYDYQTPTIVGTQIRLVKQSDTNILKFKLDADLSGDAITISLDAGATNKPLVDIDGVAVTELDKGFVEVVENSINFTYAPKGGAKFEEISGRIIPLAESASYGGYIMTLTQDDEYIYCGGYTTNKVWKIRKSDMTKVAESADYGDYITTLIQDDEYIYCGGHGTKVWKIRKSNMSKVAESASYGGGNIYTIASDGTYLYAGGDTIRKVWKIRKSDMTKVAESENYGGNINALTQDDEYIYCGGYYTPGKVWKIRKSDMTKVTESTRYGNIYALTQDNEYVYCGGDDLTVWQIRKSDMVRVAKSTSYGGIIRALIRNDKYIYCAGTDVQKVWELENMVKVIESLDYSGEIYDLAKDDEYIYCAGAQQRVWKMTSQVYIKK